MWLHRATFLSLGPQLLWVHLQIDSIWIYFISPLSHVMPPYSSFCNILFHPLVSFFKMTERIRFIYLNTYLKLKDLFCNSKLSLKWEHSRVITFFSRQLQQHRMLNCSCLDTRWCWSMPHNKVTGLNLLARWVYVEFAYTFKHISLCVKRKSLLFSLFPDRCAFFSVAFSF